jgi:hypothetical protein
MVKDTEIWGNCTICIHPKRAELENTWLNKEPGRPNWSIRRMARYYDVSASAIERHCLRHVWLSFDSPGEQITAEEYFQDVFDGISYIEPGRKDVQRKYEQWLQKRAVTQQGELSV